jgi:hypothetical protein
MNFTINVSQFNDLSTQIRKFANTEGLKIAAMYVKEQEKIQTSIGRDFEGRPFAPYKRSTIRQRRRLGLRTDKVNLWVTGTVSNSRYFDSTTKELKYPYLTEPIAGYLQEGTRTMREREFVGISKLDVPEIEKRVGSALQAKFS